MKIHNVSLRLNGWEDEEARERMQERMKERGVGGRDRGRGMIFIEGDKAWCLFPRGGGGVEGGGHKLIFLFFLLINTALPTYCLSVSCWDRVTVRLRAGSVWNQPPQPLSCALIVFTG